MTSFMNGLRRRQSMKPSKRSMKRRRVHGLPAFGCHEIVEPSERLMTRRKTTLRKCRSNERGSAEHKVLGKRIT